MVIACQVWWCFVVGGPGVPDPVHGPADPAGHLHQPSPSGEAHRGVCQEQRYAGKYSICSCPTFISTINLMRIRLRYLALRTYQCFGSVFRIRIRTDPYKDIPSGSASSLENIHVL